MLNEQSLKINRTSKGMIAECVVLEGSGSGSDRAMSEDHSCDTPPGGNLSGTGPVTVTSSTGSTQTSGTFSTVNGSTSQVNLTYTSNGVSSNYTINSSSSSGSTYYYNQPSGGFTGNVNWGNCTGSFTQTK